MLALLASGEARGNDPAGREAQLRAANAGLVSQSQRVLLQLYSLQSRLGQTEQRIAALQQRSARLEREEEAAKEQLEIARQNMAAARGRLGERLRQLYIEGDVDPLAVLLGAESLDDALSALDGLNRLAEQDRDIIKQLETARVALQTAITRLAAKRAAVRTLVAQAKAARAALLRAREQRSSYLASLRRQQDLNRAQISRLNAQAAASAELSQQISSGGSGAAAPPAPPPPPPPPAGGRKMTVSSTGYCLEGSTATGIPVSSGVIAVDPAVIPLGTRMFVPGYGEGVAADTGSAVKGAMIDVWFPTCARARQWGRRTVTITLH
jgi:peptidoglycan DL-endopeptidase CwlO